MVVALRKESVDRNYIIKITGTAPRRVALRKESVDRNPYLDNKPTQRAVALRKESVDRNFDAVQIVVVIVQSLSARRAWIEMREKFALSLLTYRRSPQGERG